MRPATVPWIGLLAVAVVASVGLLWKIDERYLWQDEAAIALLGERLVTHGKPLGWDGRNLITMDIYNRAEFASGRVPTRDAEDAVRFFVGRGDFKEDTTWIRHPWGTLAMAGASVRLFGRGTLQARLPFALTAVGAAVLLWWLVRRRFDDPWVAGVAVALCVTNVYWLLHMRQCHYNAPSCLMMLVTLACYLRWQSGLRFGAAGFVAAAWVWFQFDYGSVWPALAVLFVDAARASWPRVWRPWPVALALAAALAPFVAYYELLGRSSYAMQSRPFRFLVGHVLQINQYMVPLVVLVVAALAVWFLRRRIQAGQGRFLGLCVAIPVMTVAWLPLVAPANYYRYVVHLTPLAAILAACGVVHLAHGLGKRRARLAAVVMTAAVAVVPLPSNLVSWAAGYTVETGTFLRHEWSVFARELAGSLPDPNGEVIRAVADRLEDGDEILVNYEDKPFMFYTNARIRGGIPAFRVDDPSPPRFFVFRQTAVFTEQQLFGAAARRHEWNRMPVEAADLPSSNSPEPRLRRHLTRTDLPNVGVFELRPPRGAPD